MVEEPKFLPALSAVVDIVNSCGGKGVIIGGIAVGLLAGPRATKDIDALLLSPIDDIDEVWKTAQQNGFELLIPNALEQARLSRFLRLRHKSTGVAVDLQVAIWPIDYEIVERGLPWSYKGLDFHVATAEDLIILKTIAARPQDLLDINTMFTVLENIDKGRVRFFLNEYRELVENPDTIDQILAKYL